MNVVCTVEGHGELAAVPVLLRRLASTRNRSMEVRAPIRLPRGKLVQQTELDRALKLAAKQVGREGRVLVLLDADDDCPADLGPRLREWAGAARSDMRISVVLANREFEAWLIAAAESIGERRGLPPTLQPPDDPEAVRDAKGWLSERMGRRYSASVDQAALAAVDIDLARSRSPSFDKLVREFDGWW